MKKTLTTLVLIAGCCTFAAAQVNHPNSKEKQALEQTQTLFGPKYIDALVIKALAENSPTYFNAPGLPRFSVIGRDRKFYLGIGGYLKTTLSYDFKNPVDNASSFNPSSIPMSQQKGNGGLVQLGAQTSNISFNFVALPENKHKVGVYINFNFDGTDYQPYLMNAYAKYRGFTIGYGTSLFTDGMADPSTIDFAGPNSFTIVLNTVIDYEYKWGKHWGTGVGLEMPMDSYTNGERTYTVNQRIPDVPFYLQYSWNERSSWVRVSGLVRNLYYYDEVSDKTRNNTGLGVKLSGSTVICKKLTSFYQGLYGKGISNYIQDMNGAGLDMLPSRDRQGKLDNLTSWGGYAGLQYNFTPTMFMSAMYSFVRTSASDVAYLPTRYKSGQYIAANMFWNIAPQIQMGAEYLWGDRENANGQKRHDTRIQTMFQFNF